MRTGRTVIYLKNYSRHKWKIKKSIVNRSLRLPFIFHFLQRVIFTSSLVVYGSFTIKSTHENCGKSVHKRPHPPPLRSKQLKRPTTVYNILIDAFIDILFIDAGWASFQRVAIHTSSYSQIFKFWLLENGILNDFFIL